MKELLFPLLTANDIDLRVGTVKKEKDGTISGFSLLLYKDARVDMKLLDEVIGWNNWKREHQELKGVIYCGVSIYDDEKKEWITKWDAGCESNTEKEKGEASDSFKRACVNFGIGRELYTAPLVWIKGYDTYTRFEVKEIGYNEIREINRLVIVESKSQKVVYEMGKKVSSEPKLSLDILNDCVRLGIDLRKAAIYLKKDYEALTDTDMKPLIEMKKERLGVKEDEANI